MNARTRAYITEGLLTTRELSALIGIAESTLYKRYERDHRVAVRKGTILLWARRDIPSIRAVRA